MTTLTAPRLVGSRDQARQLADELAPDLSDSVVIVDCGVLEASTSSFVDELVKICLLERNAQRLVFKHASPRVVQLAVRAARNREVSDRLEIQTSQA
jgi:hypothetical protein